MTISRTFAHGFVLHLHHRFSHKHDCVCMSVANSNQSFGEIAKDFGIIGIGFLKGQNISETLGIIINHNLEFLKLKKVGMHISRHTVAKSQFLFKKSNSQYLISILAWKFKFNVGVDFIKIEFLDKKIEILHQCARVDRKDVVDKSRSFLIKVNCSRMNEKFKVEEKKNRPYRIW